MRVTVWAFALCFAAVTVVSWRYLFILPIVFSIVITVFDCGGMAFSEAHLKPFVSEIWVLFAEFVRRPTLR
jgi:hypothetical protein